MKNGKRNAKSNIENEKKFFLNVRVGVCECVCEFSEIRFFITQLIE